jgi:arylsulfatase A-like enzyme
MTAGRLSLPTPTISGWSNFNDNTWELYHTEEDRAELHDLAAAHPDKLRELVNLWFAEASGNKPPSRSTTAQQWKSSRRRGRC